nr:EAL domain-containing protein [Pseudaminobacter soli]
MKEFQQEWSGSRETWPVDAWNNAKASLVRSAERYEALLQASAMVFWTSCPTGQATRGWGWSELSGQDEAEYSGQGWLATVHPEDQDRVVAHWQECVRSGVWFQAEYRVRHATGEYRWVSAKAVPLRDGDGSIREWVGVLMDVEERRLAEEALRTSEERLRLAIETTALGIWDVDLILDRHQWSAETRQILGIAADTPITGDTFLNRVHPEDRPHVERTFYKDQSEPGTSFSGICRINRADNGGERWVAASGRTISDENRQPIRRIGTIWDITAQKRAEEARHASEERLRLALNAARMIAWEQDLTTNYITRTPNAAGLIGIGSGPLSEFLDRIHPDDRHLREHLLSQSDVKSSESIEFRYTTPHGETLWLGLRAEKAGPNRLVGVTFDITERKAAEEEIWRVANHDALTGLPNRALFQRRLEQALGEGHRRGTSVSLLLIDLDHFKDVNDALGHDAGDALLKEIAARLTAMVREGDTVARFGGDEFAVIIGEPLTLRHATLLVDIMLEQLRRPFVYAERTFIGRASIGVAAFPNHGADAKELLKNADIALYRAKAEGRNRAINYSAELRIAVEERLALNEEVREALARREFIPFYQPKVCLRTSRIVGFEALARWQHPAKGILTPAYFGAVFSDLELSLRIGQELITRVISDTREWLDQDLEIGRVAINLSSAEFTVDGVAERILSLLHQKEVPTERFEVEVTETVLLGRGIVDIAAILNRFHEHGVQIALDDFGTGYASLTHLKQFPVDHVKIDKSFVRGLEQDAGDQAIVAGIIGLGRNLGMQITAEGVETLAQAQRLRGLGCDNAQGFLYSEPVEGSMVPKLLRSWKGQPTGLHDEKPTRLRA